MTTRRYLALLLTAWTAAVLCGHAASWAEWADRLPARLATHWSTGGADQSMTRNGWLITISLFPVAIAIAATVVLAYSQVSRHLMGRRVFAMTLMGLAGFILGLQATIIEANLDVSDWRDADTSWRAVLLMLSFPMVGAAIGWLLPVGRADQHAAPTIASAMEIPEGQHIVWTGRVTARWAAWLGATSFAALLVVAIVSGLGMGTPFWPVPLTLLLVTVAGALFTSVSVSAGQQGVVMRFGLLGWPMWRIRLEDITGASAEDHKALSVGGWGLRITPRGTAVMLRSGSCLVLHRKHRNRIFIGIDNPEPAAALVNGLIQRADRAC